MMVLLSSVRPSVPPSTNAFLTYNSVASLIEAFTPAAGKALATSPNPLSMFNVPKPSNATSKIPEAISDVMFFHSGTFKDSASF